MKNGAIDDAFSCVSSVNTPGLTKNTQNFESELIKIRKAKELLAKLTGVEYGLRIKIEQIISQATKKTQDLVKEKEQHKLLTEYEQTFKCLSLEPFKWRDNNGNPKLVIFSKDDYLFELTAFSSKRFETRPKRLPKKIVDQYLDVFELLAEKRIKRKVLTLSCNFNALIPASTKTIMEAAEKVFADEIYLIAEPKKLTVNEDTSIKLNKVLVVGYNPDAGENRLWLITDFHPISIEEALNIEKKEVSNDNQ